ncbi:MAG: hypothetical protein J6Q15_03565 [Clostridia bacterium]|nr:hypothetical protein [Clostridia bacterium]
MKITNYKQFIVHLKSLKTQQEQINFIMKYFVDKVEFDYLVIEAIKIPYSLIDEIDNKFDSSNKDEVNQALQYAKFKGLSYGLIKRLSQIYGNPFTIPARPAYNGTLGFIPAQPERISHRTFGATINMSKPQPTYKNGLIIKGVCADFVEFIKKVCDDIGVKYNTISGQSTVSHAWIKIDGLYYDPTYAIYVRDKFMDWDKKSTIDDWFGMTNAQLFHLHPIRVIDEIDGVHLSEQITSANFQSLTQN